MHMHMLHMHMLHMHMLHMHMRMHMSCTCHARAMHVPCMCQVALPGGTILVLTCGDPTGNKRRLLGSGGSSAATPGTQVCA
jgi:hypothetical protein